MRRLTALGSVFAIIVAMVAAGLVGTAAAQTASLADHPLTGVWLYSQGGSGVGQAVYSSDGTNLSFGTISVMGAKGVEFSSPTIGTWEAEDERTGHFTAVWVTSDADGNYLSSYTLEGYPKVSEDGQTFVDDMSRVVVTVRDPLGVVTDVFHPSDAPPVKGIRVGPGAPGVPDFPWAAASAAP